VFEGISFHGAILADKLIRWLGIKGSLGSSSPTLPKANGVWACGIKGQLGHGWSKKSKTIVYVHLGTFMLQI
jgi:hypothetical protein